MQADREQLAMAAQVRDEHRAPATCPECFGIGPCRRYATWFPTIAELPPLPKPWPPGDPDSWWL